MPRPISHDLRSVLASFPHGRTKGRFLDWLLLRFHKVRNRPRDARGRRRRPHRQLLSAAVECVLQRFPEPVCIETGCIRDRGEGTDSTLAIASMLGRQGVLYTFELDPNHIAICREVCREFDDRIRYVPGDAKAGLHRLREDGTLRAVHLAFLDSADDPEQIFAEFQAVEDLFVPGSIVVVDDVIFPAVKGLRIRPYLHRQPEWDTYVLYTWHGMLVALRRQPA